MKKSLKYLQELCVIHEALEKSLPKPTKSMLNSLSQA